MRRWGWYTPPSAEYAYTRAWIVGGVGVVMIVIGTIVSAGGATLVGLLFCLFALIWFWHGRRTSRIDRDQDGM